MTKKVIAWRESATPTSAMADGVVVFLLGQLSDLIIREAALLLGAADQLRALRSELDWIRCFIRDAAALPAADDRAKLWLSQLRDVSYDAEDVIESFLLRRLLRRQPSLLSCFAADAAAARSLGKKIEDINRRLEHISSNHSKYGTVALPTENDERRTGTSRLPASAEEPDVVGLERDAGVLLSRLVDGEARRAVVSIVGMGGVGKTTLAQKLCRHARVRRAFDCVAWATVSQASHLRDLLHGVVISVVVLTSEEAAVAEKMSEVELGQLLRQRLEGMKYLVVIDDVWSKEDWSRLRPSFPDVKNGSRIVLTTRNKDVALFADARSLPHELQCLSEDESWALFCNRAFFADDAGARCPSDLEHVGRAIVAKCHGLPLAIVVVAGLLSRRTPSPAEWERVLQSLSWQLLHGDDKIAGILLLSYKDLPHYLKPCFLYLGLFPEDAEIPTAKLARMWAAEGMAQRRGDEAPEDVAEDHLAELVHRSLVQVGSMSADGRIKSCRLHDLLRDLAIEEAKEERFLCYHDAMESSTTNHAAIVRKVAVNSSIAEYLSAARFDDSLGLRSLLCYTEDEVLRIKEVRILLGSFRLLRVMVLDGVLISKLPTEIGDLIHLRYIAIRETHMKALPSSICNLYNLQTLDVKNTMPISIPAGISKLHNLRHLCIGWLKIPGNAQIGLLSNIRSLSTAATGSWIEGGLCKLTNLRELAIRGDLDRYEKAISESVRKLGALRSLRLRGEKSVPVTSLSASISHHVHLYKLSLKGRMQAFLRPSELPPNLTKITLDSSKLELDPMPMLGKLPKLQVLRLAWNAYMGGEMVCSACGFPQLRVLKLEQLHELKEWRLEQGAMLKLRSLRIIKCNKLKELPGGLQHLTSLQKLKLREMPEEFLARSIDQKGSNWLTEQHIPYITIRK